jgi:two-component system phosphate regulon sensor histidine kinase PhoR
MSVRQRLFAYFLAMSIALVAVVGGLLYDTVADEARGAIESRLSSEVRMVSTELAAAETPASMSALDERVDALAAAADARITVVASDGRVMADSQFDGEALAALDNHASRPEVREAYATGEGRSVRYSRSVDVEMLYRSRRIRGGPWDGGIARMAVPLTRVEAARRSAMAEVMIALGIGLAAALLAAGLSSRRLSRPIQELRATAARVMAGDLEARARIATGDEIEDLADSLNAATARLAERIEAAASERNRLEGVLDAMVEGVLVTDFAGRVALANAALLAMFGSEGPVQNRTPLQVLRHPEAADALAAAARERKPVARDIHIRWPQERTLAVHAVPLPAGGSVGVFHDVTERRRLDDMRRDFVANVSHELRTPLATLAGYAEELADATPAPEETRRSAGVIKRHVERLATLVEDLLQLARIEAEGFTPEREPFDVLALIEDLAREWAPRAAKRDMKIMVDPSERRVIEADRGLLRQALVHLLDNALRYAPEGTTVRIGARPAPRGIELAVADQGPGIPLEDQPRVFERFYRIEKGRGRDTGGTGLGLAIVKHVAEAHGGSAAVSSRPGAGATFRLFIPS